MTKITDDLAERGVEVLKRIAVATLSLDDASFISGWVHDARNALRAQGGVSMSLKWIRENYGVPHTKAVSAVGLYTINVTSGHRYQLNRNYTTPGSFFDTIEQAKAAAQADYARRVLSSLEASPDPVSEEMVLMPRALDGVALHSLANYLGYTPEETDELYSEIVSRAAIAAKGGGVSHGQ